MKCVNNCRCGKHEQHKTMHPPNQFTRARYPQLAQSERMRMVTTERHTRGTVWRGTPSDDYDWDAAIERLYAIFDQVYGTRWRARLKR